MSDEQLSTRLLQSKDSKERVMYFHKGTKQQEDWIQLKVSYTLPGRHWLGPELPIVKLLKDMSLHMIVFCYFSTVLIGSIFFLEPRRRAACHFIKKKKKGATRERSKTNPEPPTRMLQREGRETNPKISHSTKTKRKNMLIDSMTCKFNNNSYIVETLSYMYIWVSGNSSLCPS